MGEIWDKKCFRSGLYVKIPAIDLTIDQIRQAIGWIVDISGKRMYLIPKQYKFAATE